MTVSVPRIEKLLAEADEAVLRAFAIPPPCTSETLRLRQRGRLAPAPFTYDWWRQLGLSSDQSAALAPFSFEEQGGDDG